MSLCLQGTGTISFDMKLNYIPCRLFIVSILMCSVYICLYIGVSHNCLYCGLTNKVMNVPMYYKTGGMLTGSHVFRNALDNSVNLVLIKSCLT